MKLKKHLVAAKKPSWQVSQPCNQLRDIVSLKYGDILDIMLNKTDPVEYRDFTKDDNLSSEGAA